MLARAFLPEISRENRTTAVRHTTRHAIQLLYMYVHKRTFSRASVGCRVRRRRAAATYEPKPLFGRHRRLGSSRLGLGDLGEVRLRGLGRLVGAGLDVPLLRRALGRKRVERRLAHVLVDGDGDGLETNRQSRRVARRARDMEPPVAHNVVMAPQEPAPALVEAAAAGPVVGRRPDRPCRRDPPRSACQREARRAACRAQSSFKLA